MVTGASGQVGVDLLDVLAGLTPLGGDPSYPTVTLLTLTSSTYLV
jgi:hypothetical protein